MSFLSCWHITGMPDEVVTILQNDLQNYDKEAKQSELYGSEVDKVIRNSSNVWIPTSHWIGGWLWYYIDKINRENFCYDITEIDGGSIQYTQYTEGQFYNWHKDADVDILYKPKEVPSSGCILTEDKISMSGEYVRKLSFILQLSNPSDYTGGEVQFLDNRDKTFFAPKQQGTVIVFDSRTRHRVRKIRSGIRKSIVGWVVGPRWK
jgi:hypothetical protein